MDDDEVDAMTANLPTMFAPTVASMTKGNVSPHYSGPSIVETYHSDHDSPPEDPCQWLDMSEYIDESTPTHSRDQYAEERAVGEETSILDDQYFNYELGDEDQSDFLDRILGIVDKPEPTIPATISPHTEVSTNDTLCPSQQSPRTPSVPSPTSQVGDTTLRDKFLATAKTFQGSRIDPSDIEAMISRILRPTSQTDYPSNSIIQHTHEPPLSGSMTGGFGSQYRRPDLPETSMEPGPNGTVFFHYDGARAATKRRHLSRDPSSTT